MNLANQANDLNEFLVLRPEFGSFQNVVYHKMKLLESLLGLFVETILELHYEYQKENLCQNGESSIKYADN